MTIQKIKAGRVNGIDADSFVGDRGQLFYNEGIGDLRVSDGETPGGIALVLGGGGGGGSYTLPTASTTIKGGVKIDGTTIAIANQVISVGTIPYSKISDPPSIPSNTNQLTNGAGYITSSALSTYALSSSVPTNNNQLTNGAGYITSSALSGYATESYVTGRGYLTAVSWNDVSGKPTLFSGSYADLTNKPTLITSYTQLTDQPSLFSGSYTDLTNKPTIPTDINQLTDASGLLGGGGGGGGTTYITNTVENPYSFSIAGDDSTLREIANGESIKISGSSGITVTTDAEGNVTITGPSLAGLATETYVTTQGYITSSALTGLATETFVTTRGYLTTVSYADVTDKPTLFSGSYTDLTNKPTLFSGSYTDLTNKPTLFSGSYADLTNKPTIPTDNNQLANGAGYITSSALTGLATETYVTTRGYITSSALTGLATETYVNQAVTNLVDGAPAMLDTLKELALSLNNDSNLAATLVTEINKKANIADLVLTIAGDDSTEKTISLGEGIRLQGTGNITITTDLEGKVTINGAAPDLSAYALTSAVPTNNNQLTNGAGYITTAVNANGTFSLPILSAEPVNLQAGQIALANGTSWDPLVKNDGKPYMAIYTGSVWIDIGGLTRTDVYTQILELG